MQCQKCKKALSAKSIKCSFTCKGTCQGTFHKGCVKGLEADLKSGKIRKFCNNCEPEFMESDTPLEDEDDDDADEKVANIDSEMLRKIYKKLKILDNVSQQLADLKNSVEFLSSKYDEMQKEHKNTEEKVQKIEKQTKNTSNQCIYLEKCNLALEQRIQELEQESRKSNMVVVGVEQKENEETMGLVTRLAEILGLTCGGVEWARRMPAHKAGQPAPILVGFGGRAARDAWLAQRRSHSTLTSGHITGDTNERRVYLNEDLTRDTRRLLWKAKTDLRETEVSMPASLIPKINNPKILQNLSIIIWFGKVVNRTHSCVMDVTNMVNETGWINAEQTLLNSSIDLEGIDTSQFPFPNTLWLVKPWNEIVMKVGILAPIVIVGVILNCIILVTLWKNRWLWSPSNFLVANLAAADLLTLLMGPWMMLVQDFYQNYVLGRFGCRLEGFLQGTMLLAGVFAVLLVSYDRLAAAALTSEARVTKNAAPQLVILTWILAAAICLPLAIFRTYNERQWLNFLETYCVENVRVLSIYWHVLIAVLVWFPLGVMTVTYGTILWRLERSGRELVSRGGGACVVRAKDRAMRVTACVLLAAVVCRVPFTALAYWRNRLQANIQINAVDGSFQAMWFAAHYLMYLNSAINPLIYGFTNERFRRAMDRTPGLRWCKFGTWCCVCPGLCKKNKKGTDKSTENIFVVEESPKPNKKLSKVLKNMLHINQDTLNFTLPRTEELSLKPTKVTPLKIENI